MLNPCCCKHAATTHTCCRIKRSANRFQPLSCYESLRNIYNYGNVRNKCRARRHLTFFWLSSARYVHQSQVGHLQPLEIFISATRHTAHFVEGYTRPARFLARICFPTANGFHMLAFCKRQIGKIMSEQKSATSVWFLPPLVFRKPKINNIPGIFV